MNRDIVTIKEREWEEEQYISPSGITYNYKAIVDFPNNDVSSDTFVDAALSDKCQYHFLWCVQTVSNNLIFRCDRKPVSEESESPIVEDWGEMPVTNSAGEYLKDSESYIVNSYGYRGVHYDGDLEFVIYYTNSAEPN